MKSIALCLLTLLSSFAWANTNCDGRVQIPAFKSDADVAVDFDTLVADGRMGLWASITDDGDEYIVLRILSVEQTAEGTLVKTQYLQEESSTLNFIYTKDANGVETLQQFEGVEGGVGFGPGTLNCHAS